jgi:hypothetical protein
MGKVKFEVNGFEEDSDSIIKGAAEIDGTLTFPNLSPGVLQVDSNHNVYSSVIYGVQGTTGTQGANGTQGVQGTTGLQGIVGSTGAQGTQGLLGLQGTQGIIGIQGATGIQGKNGAQGMQGIQGFGYSQLQGVQGPQGPSASLSKPTGISLLEYVGDITGITFGIGKI